MKTNYRITKEMVDSVIDNGEIIEMEDFFENLLWHEEIMNNKNYEIMETSYPGISLVLSEDKRLECHQAIRDSFEYEIKLEHDTGWFASLFKEHQSKIKKVTHSDAGLLNLMIYLFAPDNEAMAQQQGTSFQFHKKLKMKGLNLKNKKQSFIQSHVYDDDKENALAWETWKVVPAKRNKAILFSGSLWHSIPQVTFGDNISNGRLTQNFFIKLHRPSAL